MKAVVTDPLNVLPHPGGGPLFGIVMYLLILLQANGGAISLADFSNFLSLMR